MVAQRGRGVEAKAIAEAPAAQRGEPRLGQRGEPRAAAPAAPPPPAKSRLNFKQQHALATLPGQIAKLEAEIAQLQAALASPGLYERDRARFQRFNAALTAKQAELVLAEEDWLELEMLREAAEG
jgi:ATP-binding cassette subfamily F protein uup